MSEKFQKANTKNYKNISKNHFLSNIKQTEIRKYEIEIKSWHFNQELLFNIFNEERKINKYKRAIEILNSQFNADFAIILIFDISIGKQRIIEFTGDYDGIEFPNILEIETNSKFKNWLNYSVKTGNFVGNIILGRKIGGESFHTLQRKDFKKIGEIIANNLII